MRRTSIGSKNTEFEDTHHENDWSDDIIGNH